MDSTICPTCLYPVADGQCVNPACYANPQISETTKARWRERDAKLAAERAEREMVARAYASSFQPRTPDVPITIRKRKNGFYAQVQGQEDWHGPFKSGYDAQRAANQVFNVEA